jgi:hypothetical protein
VKKSIRIALAASVAMLAVVPASAKVTTFYKSGSWDAFGGIADDGTKVCGMGTYGSNRALVLKIFHGDNKLVVQIFKNSWHIPKGQSATVRMRFDNAQPLQGVARATNTPGFNGLELYIPRELLKDFFALLEGAARLVITFPDGNESSWQGNMIGSASATSALGACVRYLNKSDTSPAPDAPTEPFGSTPDGQPFTSDAPAPAGGFTSL